MRVFACEGMLVIVDERPTAEEGDCSIFYPKVFYERVMGLTRTTRGKSTANLAPWQVVRHKAQLSQLQGMLECIKEAIHMGDPSDPKVKEFWAKHRGRPKISMSGSTYVPPPKGFPNAPQPTILKGIQPDWQQSVTSPTRQTASGLILPS